MTAEKQTAQKQEDEPDRFPFCAHKFVDAGVTSFQVNHTLTEMKGEADRWPLENGDSIENVEQHLDDLGATDNSNWIIERRPGTAALRPYWIRHSPATPSNKICPASGSYASLEFIAQKHRLCYFVNTGNCNTAAESNLP